MDDTNSEAPDPQVFHPFLEGDESLESPNDPITYSERRHLVELGKLLPGLNWRSEMRNLQSWCLFIQPGETAHGYQIIKAPTQSTEFAPYYPNTIEDSYIVAALNAVPRYEELVQVLEQQLEKLIQIGERGNEIHKEQNQLLRAVQALAQGALRAQRDAVYWAWFYAEHSAGCPAPLMSSTGQMAEKCTCEVGQRLREKIGPPQADDAPMPPIPTTRIRMPGPGEGDNTPEVQRARARAKEEGVHEMDPTGEDDGGR